MKSLNVCRLTVLARLFLGIEVLSCTPFALSATIYVAESPQGTESGMSPADAHGISWLNSTSNWGGGGADVDPGDTVVLVGTIHTPISIQSSGSPGSPITIRFADNAKMSAPHWGDPGQAISISNKSYIVIDGGSNGLIEATNNGTELQYQDYEHRGVLLQSVNNVEVKNLTINGMFVRTPRTNGTFGGNGVRIIGANNTSVHHITVNYSNGGIYFAFGNNSNVEIHDCIHYHGANGIVVGNNGSVTLDGIDIYNNVIQLYDDSSDSSGGNTFHADGIQVFAQTAGSNIKNLRVFGNRIGPDQGTHTTSTGLIFLEGVIDSPQIFNNVLMIGSGKASPTNGFIYDKSYSGGTRNSKIWNNTIVGNGGGNGINASEDGSDIRNNILMNLNLGIYGSGAKVKDYNCYYGNNENGGSDAHGVFANPELNSTYAPVSTSPVLNAGYDLLAYFATDASGILRPQGSWSIGAYQASGSNTPSTPPASPSSLNISASF